MRHSPFIYPTPSPHVSLAPDAVHHQGIPADGGPDTDAGQAVLPQRTVNHRCHQAHLHCQLVLLEGLLLLSIFIQSNFRASFSKLKALPNCTAPVCQVTPLSVGEGSLPASVQPSSSSSFLF